MKTILFCDVDSSLNQFHGLEHFNKTRKEGEGMSWPKAMVHPDKTYGHHVHDSLDLPGYKYSDIDPNSCARMLHMINLITKRWNRLDFYPKLTVPLPSAFGVAKRHAEFWQPDDS